ncbi:clathrin light chain-domain-containing protein [Lyophyllum atratum]|nr:clathrin light chain-domain-containing protein [Lyophyllum atratum]
MTDFFQSGEDEIDFDRAASAFPDISLDGEGDIPIPTQSHPVRHDSNSGFSFDDFDSPPVQRDTTVKVTGDDELEKFQSEFPDIDVGQVCYSLAAPRCECVRHCREPPSQPSFSGATFAPRPQPSAYSSTPILNQPIEEDEPQVIKDWRAKQQAEIEARDEASKARRQETITKAESSIDEFYENYSSKKERNIRENKDQEAEYLASLSASLSTGTTWERICELVELQNSQSKTIARTGTGTTDLTRFKEVLLRLKREGDAAPGAAGY